MGPSRRVLLVEDDEILGRALENVVRREVVVERANTVAQAKRFVKRKEWDALVIDVGLPDGDGLRFLEWARAAGVTWPALVITGQFDPALVNRADLLRAQIAFKPEILPNVKAFIRRVCASVTERDTIERAVVAAEDYAREKGMTPSEVDLVRLVGEGVPRAELAGRLGISENTVKTRVRNVLDKAGLPNLDAVGRAVLAIVVRDATTRSGTHSRPSFENEPDSEVPGQSR